MPAAPRYVTIHLAFQAMNRPWNVRLRWLLKHMLRYVGFRCCWIEVHDEQQPDLRAFIIARDKARCA